MSGRARIGPWSPAACWRVSCSSPWPFSCISARSLFVDVGATTSITAAAVIAVGGAIVVIVSLTSAWRVAPGLLALAARSRLCGPARTASSPAPSDASVRQLAQLVQQARRGEGPVGTYRVFVRNLVFYTGVKQTDLINDDHLMEFVGKNPARADRAPRRGARTAGTRAPACASSDSVRSAISTRVRFGLERCFDPARTTRSDACCSCGRSARGTEVQT